MNMFSGMFKTMPCQSGWEWLREQPSLKTAWETCNRSDWMWWALSNCDCPPTFEQSIAYTEFCAEMALRLVPGSQAAQYSIWALESARDCEQIPSRAAYYASMAARYCAEASYILRVNESELLKTQANWIRENIQFPECWRKYETPLAEK